MNWAIFSHSGMGGGGDKFKGELSLPHELLPFCLSGDCIVTITLPLEAMEQHPERAFRCGRNASGALLCLLALWVAGCSLDEEAANQSRSCRIEASSGAVDGDTLEAGGILACIHHEPFR